MSEISTLREMRPVPPPAELEAMRMAARERFVAGTQSRRARQRWRLPVLAGGLTAAVAASVTAALVLTSGPGTVPGQHAPAGHARTVVTAAWTVRQAADGTVTIYVRQYANPAGLQQTLRADGINAIVRSIPNAVQTITPPVRLPGSRKPPLRVPHPTCEYMPTDTAPQSVQRAVVTFAGQDLPVAYIVHPGAMPQGSALFLTFMPGMPPSALKNDNTGIVAMRPVVLDNDTVPVCVPVTKYASTPAPKAAPTFPPKAG